MSSLTSLSLTQYFRELAVVPIIFMLCLGGTSLPVSEIKEQLAPNSTLLTEYTGIGMRS